MLRALIILIFLFLYSSLSAQIFDVQNYGPEPEGGIQRLALEYYKIEFTQAQSKQLEGIELEFVYRVDENGKATLEVVKGIKDQSIIDSLKNRTELLPKFQPLIVNGIAESSLYFMKLQFPTYKPIDRHSIPYEHYREPAIEEYEYLHKSGQRFDILIGGVLNTFTGNASEFLATGGGIKMDMFYVGKNQYGFGMVMSFYGNYLKKDYPINTTRQLEKAPPTFLFGLGINRRIKSNERREWRCQLELCYAGQNVSAKQSNNDNDYIQLNGFSAGISLNYILQLGKGKLNYYYGRPTLFSNHINFHGAIRPVLYDLKEASGIMLELGISWRLISSFIDEYKLKQ